MHHLAARLIRHLLGEIKCNVMIAIRAAAALKSSIKCADAAACETRWIKCQLAGFLFGAPAGLVAFHLLLISAARNVCPRWGRQKRGIRIETATRPGLTFQLHRLSSGPLRRLRHVPLLLFTLLFTRRLVQPQRKWGVLIVIGTSACTIVARMTTRLMLPTAPFF